ncbi:Metallo-dependent phosphatase-like protein [Pelagophyceae sp. CCMP2097]|nr:Metallo-dependent phosphatase-like protein [Pelagophyceae sp. CCMP2097]
MVQLAALALGRALHVELPASGQVFIVGDVHGCYEELLELVESLPKSGLDEVVLVGDLVNKGPESARVVKWCRENAIRAVRGNHDESALAVSQMSKKNKNKKNGGPTLAEKYSYLVDLAPEDLAYLADLPYTISLPHFHAVVVHAGLVPGVPLEAQSPEDMTRMRSLLRGADGAFLASNDAGAESWAAQWPAEAPTVVFGHDAKRGHAIYENCVGLDSGCCYGGRLTALRLPQRDVFSVQARESYAPKTG